MRVEKTNHAKAKDKRARVQDHKIFAAPAALSIAAKLACVLQTSRTATANAHRT